MTTDNPEWKKRLEEMLERRDLRKPEKQQTRLPDHGDTEQSQRFYQRFPYNRDGDKNRDIHENYLDYCYFLINHPNFADLPGVMDEESGRLYITTPDRETDNIKERREQWWKSKAEEHGMTTDREGWKTKLARKLNPTNETVCQTCGQTLDIRPVYLTKNTISKFNDVLPESEHLEKTQCITIFEAVDILLREVGEDTYDLLDDCFNKLESIERSCEAYKQKLNEMINSGKIKTRSHWLSPGKMGNPPDRLDGFHSYGSPCCRAYEDDGRDPENMKRYGRERRAYERWVNGRWSAADNLMNLTGTSECLDCDTVEELSADHIGPISLGFKHDPVNLQGLCDPCNSSKGNELRREDVKKIIELESDDVSVASRHIRTLWDECKHEVDTESDANELKQLLRNNQHQYLWVIEQLRQKEAIGPLISLLNLEESQWRYDFVEVDPGFLNYEEISREKRSKKRELNRASSSTRVAFESLIEYSSADETKRWAERVDSQELQQLWSNVIDTVDQSYDDDFNSQLRKALSKLEANPSRETRGIVKQSIKAVYQDHGYVPPGNVTPVVEALYDYMDAVGERLVAKYERGC